MTPTIPTATLCRSARQIQLRKELSQKRQAKHPDAMNPAQQCLVLSIFVFGGVLNNSGHIRGTLARPATADGTPPRALMAPTTAAIPSMPASARGYGQAPRRPWAGALTSRYGCCGYCVLGTLGL